MGNVYGLQSRKRYPLNSAEQVKTACAYFEDNYTKLNPSDRAEFAHGITKQASAFSIDTSESPNVINYSRHDQYSQEFDSQMYMRKIACGSKTAEISGKSVVLSEMFEKLASSQKDLAPINMVQNLEQLDKVAALELNYDIDGMRDPYFSVFGSVSNPDFGVEKIAADLDINSLKKFIVAPGAKDEVMTIFGENFAEAFIADPVTTYNTISQVEKQVMNDAIRSFIGGK